MDIQIIAPGSVRVANRSPFSSRNIVSTDFAIHIINYVIKIVMSYRKMWRQNFRKIKKWFLTRDLILKHVISKYGHLKFREKMMLKCALGQMP